MSTLQDQGTPLSSQDTSSSLFKNQLLLSTQVCMSNTYIQRRLECATWPVHANKLAQQQHQAGEAEPASERTPGNELND